MNTKSSPSTLKAKQSAPKERGRVVPLSLFDFHMMSFVNTTYVHTCPTSTLILDLIIIHTQQIHITVKWNLAFLNNLSV